jgi:PKD repeat protein
LANAVKNNKAAPLSFTRLEATPQYTALPRDVQFRATAANGTGPYTYRWDFGDGTNSALQNPPVHNYAGPYPGTPAAYYEATVQVTDSTGKSACGIIRIAAPLDGDIKFPDYAKKNTDIDFEIDNVKGGFSGEYYYYWDFKDGTTVWEKTKKHKYANAGTYAVRAEVGDKQDDNNCDGGTWNIIITEPVAITNYTANRTTAAKSTNITFDVTPGGGSGTYTYEWDFGDGNNSAIKNPTHAYNTAGDKTVKVTVKDKEDNANSATKNTLTIKITEPVAITNYTANRTTAAKSTNITFNVTHSGGSGTYTYAWDFGDGNTSTTQNPTHAYNAAGDKTVKVTVKDTNDNANSATKNTLTVKITGPVTITYTASSASALVNANITFNVTPGGGSGDYTYEWKFGDGQTSATKNPTHAYNAAGEKTVELTVKDTKDNANSAAKSNLKVTIT